MARVNQRKQALPTRAKQNPKGKTRKADRKRATSFAQKSKEAALKHSQSVRNDKRKLLYSSLSENKSLLKTSPKQLQSSSTMKTFNIRETPGGPIFRITVYSDANNFMNSPSNSAATPALANTDQPHALIESLTTSGKEILRRINLRMTILSKSCISTARTLLANKHTR